MRPPTPHDRADSIICAVNAHVALDLEPVKAELLERLEEPSEEFILERAERIARDSIESTWGPELLEQCAKGLAEAHEEFLVTAAKCLEAAQDLEEFGLESWIGGAVRQMQAVDICWNTLDGRHGVEWHYCDDGQGE